MVKWKEVTLGEISTDISYGYTESATDKPIGPKFLRITDIANGRLEWDKVPYCPITIENRSKYLLNPGDIVVARTGATTGATYMMKKNDPQDVVYASYLIRYKIDQSRAVPQFIDYQLRSNYWSLFVEGIVGGSAQPGANAKQFASFEFLLPPLPEQRAIASVLSSLDDKIDLLHRQNATLEAMAETIFRQWFVEEAGEDWGWVKLGELIDVHRGLSYKGAGLTVEGEGVPMHNLNSVHEGGAYKYEGIKYYSGEYKDRHLIVPGDVIVTNTEQGHELLLIGYPAIVPKYFSNLGIFSQHIFKLEIKSPVLTEPFLYYLLMTFDVREQITGATNGSTVNMLPKDGIEWAKFKLPPSQKVKDFTEFARPVIAKKEANFVQIKKIEKLRDTLLPKLMSGEVRL